MISESNHPTQQVPRDGWIVQQFEHVETLSLNMFKLNGFLNHIGESQN